MNVWIFYILPALVVVGVSLLLLCVRMLIRRDGRFSSEHISENKRMRRDGIHCATSQDREARRASVNKLDVSKL